MGEAAFTEIAMRNVRALLRSRRVLEEAEREQARRMREADSSIRASLSRRSDESTMISDVASPTRRPRRTSIALVQLFELSVSPPPGHPEVSPFRIKQPAEPSWVSRDRHDYLLYDMPTASRLKPTPIAYYGDWPRRLDRRFPRPGGSRGSSRIDGSSPREVRVLTVRAGPGREMLDSEGHAARSERGTWNHDDGGDESPRAASSPKVSRTAPRAPSRSPRSDGRPADTTETILTGIRENPRRARRHGWRHPNGRATAKTRKRLGDAELRAVRRIAGIGRRGRACLARRPAARACSDSPGGHGPGGTFSRLMNCRFVRL